MINNLRVEFTNLLDDANGSGSGDVPDPVFNCSERASWQLLVRVNAKTVSSSSINGRLDGQRRIRLHL